MESLCWTTVPAKPMRFLIILGLATVFALVNLQGSRAAAPCAADNKTRVAANGECLVIRAYGEPAKRTTLLVLIHGDGWTDGGQTIPSDYLYPIARLYAAKGIVAVGLIRPGYYDSYSNYSTGNDFGRKDGYRPNVIKTIAEAVETLKEHYGADYIILAGRSGGSAIAGVIMGKYPGLADAAVLGACPCHVPRWRSQRGDNAYPTSLSPHKFVKNVAKDARIFAITGSKDTNTRPSLAKYYVSQLRKQGVDATYLEAAGSGHTRSENTSEFKRSLFGLLEGRSYGKLP